jgi:Holliday junction resolvasome RuvABC endonuclease subunit
VRTIKILAIDQARHGGWAIFDYKNKTLCDYGAFCYSTSGSTFPQETVLIENFIEEKIVSDGISAVFIEDIHMSKNVNTFKNLARLQGVLINLFEKNNYLYGIITPSQWQSFCKAKGRTSKEIKSKVLSSDASEKKFNKRRTKIMSIEYVKSKFKVDTLDDNIADAICIGDYVVNNIPIISE